jgi:UDP-3-O-[3-hydroxymyristoyl] glucosamine N-acyltransferase
MGASPLEDAAVWGADPLSMTSNKLNISITINELARVVGAVPEPLSAANVEITAVGSPGTAVAGTLLFAGDAKALQAAEASDGAAILLTPALWGASSSGGKPKLVVAQPKLAFAMAARLLQERRQRAERKAAASAGVHPQAWVEGTACLAEAVVVGPFAVVEAGVVLGTGTRVDAGTVVGANCVLGADCHLYPRVVLYPGTQLGDRVIVHAGAILGSDGFGYVRDAATGAYTQFPQQGRLIIGDDVEIGANTTIDRGALDETRIGRGVKIDNLVHIGHNVRVGADVVIAAQTGISGSSTIGAGAVVAGQVGIADHVRIGPGTVLGAQCGVPSNKRIEGPGVLFWGTPARPIQQYLRELAAMARLARGGRVRRGGKEAASNDTAASDAAMRDEEER